MKSEFQQLFESFPGAMAIVQDSGQIRQANAQAASLFGYPFTQLEGQPIDVLFPGQMLDASLGNSGRRKQAARRAELVGRRSDSSQFPAEVGMIPLRTSQGMATVIFIEDITELQQARLLLQRGLTVLEEEGLDCQALIGRLIQAHEDERARIAADIHNDTIQIISAASLRLGQLAHRIHDPDQLIILDKFEQTLRLSLSRLRQLVFSLRPSNLAGNAAAVIQADLDQLRSDTGIRYRIHDSLTTPIPVPVTVVIHRIAREALANVRKHSQARTVDVQLLNVDGGCLVIIADDGVGYDPAEVERRPGHLGLALMRQRARLAGGWCRIESAPEAGTTVEFWIPIEASTSQPETAGEPAA